MTLIEVMIGMALFSVVVATVDAGVNVVSSQQNQMTAQTEAVDQLQSAEETLTRDLHAASSWQGPPTATSLSFVASLPTASSPTNAPTINATISEYSLTVTSTVNALTTQVAKVDKLDAAYSGFTPWDCRTVNLAGNTVDYYVAVSVKLTIDAPKYGAAPGPRTSVTDSHVQVWNVLWADQVAGQQTGATTGTCPSS
jgi:type II secretory pathway pseudopilin PulG